MTPYLKGFHLTIEMWRGGRDADGWKLKESEDYSDLQSIEYEESSLGSESSVVTVADVELAGAAHHLLCAPTRLYAPADGITKPAPRLREDIAALIRLSDFELPPLRLVRPSRVIQVYYGFGDASGKQYGSTISDDHNRQPRLSPEADDCNGIRYRIGLWSAGEEAESSNYKELANL